MKTELITINRPPILSDLLAFSQYKKYFFTEPTMPKQQLNHPWQVWAHKSDNSGWASKTTKTYSDALLFIKKYVNHTDRFDDLCIVSRSILHREPWHKEVHQLTKRVIDSYPLFRGLWDRNLYEWCMRCRRPTVFEYWRKPTHRALKAAPILSEEEPYRCYYCGARRSFAGG